MYDNIDRKTLKALAEAAGSDEWYADGDLRYCDDKTGETHGLHHDDSRFIAAASPATILALLAEIERLSSGRSKKERELEQELEVWRHGPSCWTCGDTGDVHDITGEWRGECDCLAAQVINGNRERDQLKAEKEVLRNGIGAIRVVAGCPVDGKVIPVVDALRKDAERYRWLRDKSESVHQFYLSTPIWFTGVKFTPENVDSTIDTAMVEGVSHV